MIAALSLLVTVLGGQQASLPTWSLPWEKAATVQHEGHTYVVRGGNILGEACFSRWSDLVAPTAAPTAPLDWKLKVLILGLVEAPISGQPGRSRFGDIPADREGDVRRELEIFGKIVLKGTEGRVRLSFDVESSREPMTLPLPPAFLATRVQPDWCRSALVIHAAATTGVQEEDVNGVPVTALSFPALDDPSRPGTLALHLYRAWLGQVLRAAALTGYATSGPVYGGVNGLPLPPLASSLVSDSMWSAIAAGDYQAARLPDRNAGIQLSDPFRVKPPSLDDRSPNEQTLSETWFAKVTQPNADVMPLLWVRPAFVRLFAESAKDATLLGYEPNEGYFVFEAKANCRTDSQWLGWEVSPGVSPGKWPYSHPIDSNEAETLETRGAVKLASAQDGDRGIVARWEETASARNASVELVHCGWEGESIPEGDYRPTLSLWIKAVGKAHPIDVAVETSRGTDVVRLFPAPYEFSMQTTRVVAAPKSGEWLHAVIPLDFLRIPGTRLRAVRLQTPEEGLTQRDYIAGRAQYLIDDFKLELTRPAEASSISDPEPLVPSARSGLALARIRFVAQLLGSEAAPSQSDVDAIRSLLTDEVDDVRHIAALFFTSHKATGVETDLEPIATGLGLLAPRVALEAMAFQDTETAWALIQRIAERGPFDNQKEYAAVLLSTRRAASLKPYILGNLIVSKSWQTRAQASAGLFRLGEKTATTVGASFLNDEEAAALLTMIPEIKLADPAVLKRLGEIVANTNSEAVRSAATATLARLGKPLEGGFAKLSSTGKVSLLAALRLSDEWADPLVKSAQADPDGAIRAAAFRCLRSNADEAAAKTQERDPRVLFALLNNINRQKRTTPEWLWEALRSSNDPKLRKLAPKVP